METKHTKGDWKVVKSPSNQVRILVNHENPIETINICSISGSGADEEITSNAKLIAAAPEMLEFLIRMVGEDGFIDGRDRQDAKDLITKATK
jgi:hypothetical protein